MGLNAIKSIVGVAKQTARGTLAANPTFAHGLTGGGPINVEPKQSALDVTAGTRARSNVVRESVAAGGEIQAPTYLSALGLYLLAALGADTVTGTGPYVHTFSLADLPYLSVFFKGIDSTIEAIRDCKVDELTLKWDNSKPLQLSVKYDGTVFSYPATFTPTTDLSGSESFLTPVGGTFQTDPIGSTLAAARVTKGEIKIKNNLGAVDPSNSVEAYDQVEGAHDVTLKLTIVPDDLADFRKTVTGTAAGTAVTGNVPVGSLSLTFKENGSGTGQLVVTGSKVAFLAGFPDADAKGGPVEIELAGQAVMPAGGTAPLVFALTNTVATY